MLSGTVESMRKRNPQIDARYVCIVWCVPKRSNTTQLSRLTHLRRDEARSIIRRGVLHHRFLFGCFLIRLRVYTNKDKTATDSSLATLSGQAHVLRRMAKCGRLPRVFLRLLASLPAPTMFSSLISSNCTRRKKAAWNPELDAFNDGTRPDIST